MVIRSMRDDDLEDAMLSVDRCPLVWRFARRPSFEWELSSSTTTNQPTSVQPHHQIDLHSPSLLSPSLTPSS